MSQKNAFIIVAVVVLALIMAGGLYYYFFLKGTNWEQKFTESGFVGLFPQGEEFPPEKKPAGEEGFGSEGETALQIPKLRHISEEPIAGAVIIKTSDDKLGDRIRYVERATGHIYETYVKSEEKTRISNTTIPKVYEVVWGKGGDELIFRYLDEDTGEIISYYAKMSGEKNAEKNITGAFLQKDIYEISASNDDKLFYLTKNGSGASGIKSGIDGSGGVEVFSSPITEWLSEWSGKNGIILKTKPSSVYEGFVYYLNASNGALRKILGGIKGLTALANPDVTEIIYSSGAENSISTFIYNAEKETRKPFVVKTIPDKCVWSKKEKAIVFCAAPEYFPKGEYPESWYQGLISFEDKIWKISTEIELGSIIFDSNFYNVSSIDAVSLILNADENYILFTNKKDYSLWGIDLSPEPVEIIGD